MWANWESAMDKHRHFYVRELAQTSDGSYVVLLRWVTVANVVHADVLNMNHHDGVFSMCAGPSKRIPATCLVRNICDIQCALPHISFSRVYQSSLSMKHTLIFLHASILFRFCRSQSIM